MRQLLCDNCVAKPIHNRKPLREGTYQLYPETSEGEPAENARVMHGKARQPSNVQRTAYVNDVPHPLATTYYNCDFCNEPIFPEQSVWTLTVWKQGTPEPALWEQDFLDL